MQRIWWGVMGVLALVIWGRVAHALEVHGHRGARAREPESTIPAYQHALAAGADVLEADLNVTRDHKLVLHHDMHVNTDLCQSYDPVLRKQIKPLIRSLSLRQLQSYDCGSRYDPRFRKRTLRPGARLVSLSHFLRWLKASKIQGSATVKLNLETKIDPLNPSWSVSPEQFVTLIIRELEQENFPLGRIILQSFDFRTIIYAKRHYPTLQTSALVDREGLGSYLDVGAVWRATHADYLSPHSMLLNRANIQEAHKFGMKVVPWTLNSSIWWWYFRHLGVDGVITDDPARLIKSLR